MHFTHQCNSVQVNCDLTRGKIFMSGAVVVITCSLVQKVGQQASHDGLMTDNQNIFLPLQLHDHWFQTLDQVFIGL